MTGFGRSAAVASVSLAVVLLVGCTAQPTPAPTTSAGSSASPTPNPTSVTNTPNPVLRPGESAAANQQFFDATNQALQATQGRSTGQAIVDNLAAAGFVKADMEVTYDATALGLQADAIIVSVRIGDECLLGQFAPGYYQGDLAPVLGTGKCQVGWTRAIDW